MGRGIAGVHNHEGLFLPNHSAAVTVTFHSGMVYEPCGGKLHAAIVGDMGWYFAAGAVTQAVVMGFADYGILEEAAGAPGHARIGQLGGSYSSYLGGNLSDGRGVAQTCGIFPDRFVFKIDGNIRLSQPIAYTQHDITLFAFMFEK